MGGQIEGVAASHHDYAGSKMGMWLFLFTELLLFGGLFLLFSVYRTRYAQPFHAAAAELDTVIGAINTVVLITSSFTMALSVNALKDGKKNRSIFLLAATVCFGIVFMLNKYIEWSAKIHHGIYPNSPELLQRTHGDIIFYGLYFVMTGLHGLHVLAGIILLSAMAFLTMKGHITQAYFVRLENSGLYWHFVDIVWIYLFPIFYLIT